MFRSRFLGQPVPGCAGVGFGVATNAAFNVSQLLGLDGGPGSPPLGARVLLLVLNIVRFLIGGR